jgi:hydroxyacylglutathione hydrolase
MDYNFYKVEKVNEHIFRIVGISNEYAYLIISSKRALLIDTCCGIGNIREVVDSLTTLPYDVCLTHAHVDHLGGEGWFKDKTIYLDDKDWKSSGLQGKKFVCKMYVKSFNKLMKLNLKFTGKDFSNNKHMKFSSYKDHEVFDLGDLTIRSIPLYGHTKGMRTFLIEEDRILLTGDACNPSTFLFLPGSLSVSEYKKNLEAYIPLVKGKFDKVILSHLPKEGNPNILEDMLDVTTQIVNGAKNQDSMSMMGIKVKIFKKVNKETNFNDGDEHSANLFYKK